MNSTEQLAEEPPMLERHVDIRSARPGYPVVQRESDTVPATARAPGTIQQRGRDSGNSGGREFARGEQPGVRIAPAQFDRVFPAVSGDTPPYGSRRVRAAADRNDIDKRNTEFRFHPRFRTQKDQSG